MWLGVILIYLSLIVAEHTIKILDNGFYVALALSNLFLSSWYLLTQHERYWARLAAWFCLEICLFYAQFILQKHLYVAYPVEPAVADPFRLDSEPSPLDRDHDEIPPINIGNNEPTTTSRNINAILLRGGSLNSSPVSMSMNRRCCPMPPLFVPAALRGTVYGAHSAVSLLSIHRMR